MMKKSFSLPLVKSELFKIINLKFEQKFKKLRNTNVEDFKRIVKETKNKRKHILIHFYDSSVKIKNINFFLILLIRPKMNFFH